MLLTAGNLIIDRLEKAFPEIRVFSVGDLAEAEEFSQVTPAIQVVLHSYAPVKDDGAGEIIWREVWIVVVVVKNVSRNNKTLAKIQDAGPILNKVVSLLSGFVFPRGSGVTGELEIIPGPGPAFPGGLALLPVAVVAKPKTSGCGGYAEYV